MKAVLVGTRTLVLQYLFGPFSMSREATVVHSLVPVYALTTGGFEQLLGSGLYSVLLYSFVSKDYGEYHCVTLNYPTNHRDEASIVLGSRPASITSFSLFLR